MGIYRRLHGNCLCMERMHSCSLGSDKVHFCTVMCPTCHISKAYFQYPVRIHPTTEEISAPARTKPWSAYFGTSSFPRDLQTPELDKHLALLCQAVPNRKQI